MPKVEQISFASHQDAGRVLTPQAAQFLGRLHDRFEGRRRALLSARQARQALFDKGERPEFVLETSKVRAGSWRAREAPKALLDRRVEITGPVDRKVMVNALNSGAQVFVADLEDASSPTWDNVITGQVNLQDAVRARIELATPEKIYTLSEEAATLVVRPRGWHLVEKHFLAGGEPISASLFDFGLYLFHNSHEALSQGFGPYYYLPKLESHAEARLWEDVISFSEEELGLDHGSVRVTVLIETITAAFEMDEILYELRDHICGLSAGRWGYIFSIIRCFHKDRSFVLPDRSLLTMTTPFMRACTGLLVKTCHKRGAHAIGSVARFIPDRRTPGVAAMALAKVAEDKRREAADGFDGTLVAHPDLVPVAMAEFNAVLGKEPNQLHRKRAEVVVGPRRLLTVEHPEDGITLAALEANISVSLRYLASWLSGAGAAAIDDLMEDVASAEVSRAQVWQWAHHQMPLAGLGRARVTKGLVQHMAEEALRSLAAEGVYREELLRDARKVFEELVLSQDFQPFLTVPAYELLP
jgi:malate synthase